MTRPERVFFSAGCDVMLACGICVLFVTADEVLCLVSLVTVMVFGTVIIGGKALVSSVITYAGFNRSIEMLACRPGSCMT